MTTLRVLDFETTGLSPPEAAVCEIGYTDVSILQGEGILHHTISYLVDPLKPMQLEALAVNHITPSMLQSVELTAPQALRELAQAPVDVWVAHYKDFEQKFFNPPNSRWICTYKVGRRLWPNSPSHKNQVLRYYLGVGVDDPLGHPPHRAGPDTFITALILCQALKKISIQEMMDVSGQTVQPVLQQTIPFGKSVGKPWAQAGMSFLEYVLKNPRAEADVRFTAKYWWELRMQRAWEE